MANFASSVCTVFVSAPPTKTCLNVYVLAQDIYYLDAMLPLVYGRKLTKRRIIPFSGPKLGLAEKAASQTGLSSKTLAAQQPCEVLPTQPNPRCANGNVQRVSDTNNALRIWKEWVQ